MDTTVVGCNHGYTSCHGYDCSLKLKLCLQENLELYRADETSDKWQAYVDYIDEITVDGFFNIIHCSLQYLLENTDPAQPNQDVLFESKLELQVNRKAAY